jgi:hypothetical protein
MREVLADRCSVNFDKKALAIVGVSCEMLSVLVAEVSIRPVRGAAYAGCLLPVSRCRYWEE